MSEFWKRKIMTYFARRDFDNDGFISKKDMEDSADRLADLGNVSPEQREKIKDCLVELWRKFMKSAGSDDNGLLTASILVASVEQQKDDPEFKEAFARSFSNSFDLLNVNRDGFISLEDFIRCGAAYGVEDTSFLHAAYEHMNLSRDGMLNVDEFVSALWKYFTTEDEFPLIGPLI